MAEIIRGALQQQESLTKANRVAEPGSVYLAHSTVQDKDEDMKRIVITLPDDLHARLRRIGESGGVSMAAFVRNALEERIGRERVKPRFGAFDSGFTDTARTAGDLRLEPRAWR